MALLNGAKTSLLDSMRRLWDSLILRPILLGLALVLVLSVNVNAVVQQPSTAHAQRTTAQQLETPPLPLSSQVQDRLRHTRVTEANLTGHTLTSAHFLIHQSVGQSIGQLSAKTNTPSNQG